MEQIQSVKVEPSSTLDFQDSISKLDSEPSYSEGHSENNHVNNHVNVKHLKNNELTTRTLTDTSPPSYPKQDMNEPSSQELSPQQSPISPKQSSTQTTGVKLFIGQVPKHFNDAEVRKIFEPYGKILSCDIIKDRATQMHKGFQEI